MNRPLCSVVIPAYNVERYVAAAVESALAQTYEPVEVIVVNDGSTDGTAGALAPFTDRIVYIEQANSGVARARNRALSSASGEYVALLDADDLWVPDRLSLCIEAIERNPDELFVTTDAFLIAGEEPTTKRYYGDLVDESFPDHVDQLDALARGNFVFISVVARRSLFERAGPFDDRFPPSEDYDMWIRFALAGARAELIREPLAGYRVRPDSASADGTKQWSTHLAVLEARLPELWRAGARGAGRDAYEIARRLSARGASRQAANFYLMAARHRDLRGSARARSLARALQHLARPSAT